MRIIRPTRLTWAAAAAIGLAIAGTALYLAGAYDALPEVLVVHFDRVQLPIGWQYKTYARVMTPLFIQAALAIVSGAVAALLLSREHRLDEDSEDIRAALVAAETVVLFAAIWVVFQVYVAVALVAMWQRETGGLGRGYTPAALAGLLLTIVAGARAQARIGAPAPRPFVAEHWRWRHLYNNPADPALFVPTRDGGRWTLNFGRPIAAALMAVTLVLGVVVPAVVLRLLLR